MRNKARMTMIGMACAALACVLAAWPTDACAAEGVGEIAAVQGTVMVVRDGRVLTGKKGLRVREGDIVQTADASTARLRMDGGDRVFVAYRSRIRVSEYGRSGAGFVARFKAFFGRLLFRVQKNVMARYEVHTPTAVLGVRGTSWAMDVSKLKTQVAGFTGLVHVSGGGKGVDIGPGRFVVAGAKGPGKVQATPDSFLRQLIQGGIPADLLAMPGAAENAPAADYTLRAPAEHLAVDIPGGGKTPSVAFVGWYCAPKTGSNPLRAEIGRLYRDIWRAAGDGSPATEAGRRAAAHWRDVHLGSASAWPFDRFKGNMVRTDMNAPAGGSRVYQQGPCYTRKELEQVRAAVRQWLDAVVRGSVLRGRGLDADIARFAGVR